MNGDVGRRSEVHLTPMPYFHGRISRDEAEAALQPRDNGLYLIRESSNFPGDFTLCVCVSGYVEHYHILLINGRYTVDEEGFFQTLAELVAHYSRDADGLCCRLVKPQAKPGPPVFPHAMTPFVKSGWVLDTRDFELFEKLGQGDFATVFKARHRGQTVAAKCVSQTSSVSLLGMQEAAVMTRLADHPNIVRFYGLVQDKERVFFLTEFMESGSLVNYLRSRGRSLITPSQQMSFAIDACAAMAYLEKKGLVHRDLAARNILLDEKCNAKLGDFGMCRQTESQESSWKVPVKWTSPEAVRLNNFTHASDMWSFGVLLWEIYSYGRLPYLGIQVNDVIREVENGLRLPRPDNCPVYMYTLQQRAWSLLPDRRPTFEQTLAELRRLKGVHHPG